jgi:hypothetical protein
MFFAPSKINRYGTKYVEWIFTLGMGSNEKFLWIE